MHRKIQKCTKILAVIFHSLGKLYTNHSTTNDNEMSVNFTGRFFSPCYDGSKEQE